MIQALCQPVHPVLSTLCVMLVLLYSYLATLS